MTSISIALSVLPSLIGLVWAMGIVLGVLLVRGECPVAHDMQRIRNTERVNAKRLDRIRMARETEAMFKALEARNNRMATQAYQAQVTRARNTVRLARPALMLPCREWREYDPTSLRSLSVG
jgi:hypothetical protein